MKVCTVDTNKDWFNLGLCIDGREKNQYIYGIDGQEMN